jgi:hypothetical protein
MSANLLVQRVDAGRRIKLHGEDDRVSETHRMLDDDSNHDSNKGEIEKQSIQVMIGNEISEIFL